MQQKLEKKKKKMFSICLKQLYIQAFGHLTILEHKYTLPIFPNVYIVTVTSNCYIPRLDPSSSVNAMDLFPKFNGSPSA